MKALLIPTLLIMLSLSDSNGQAINCTDGAVLNENEIRSLQYGPTATEPVYQKQPESATYKWGYADPLRSDDTGYIQGLINTVGQNGTVYLHSGVYKVSNLKLKNGLTLVGEVGTVFTGEQRLTNTWTSLAGNQWEYAYPSEPVIFDPVMPDGQHSTKCEDGGTTCRFTQDLFINNTWQNRLASVSALAKAGDWVFDVRNPGAGDNRIVLYSTSDPNTAVTKLSMKQKAVYDNNVATDMEASRNLTGVKIYNIEFTNYTESGLTAGSSWIVANNLFKNTHLSGFNMRGTGIVVKRNVFNYNGSNGAGGSPKNSQFFENEIAFNNQAKYATGWSAGGMKSTGTQNFEVYRNYVHDNLATGLWTDVFATTTTYHHNLLERNKIGIHYEISTFGVIHNNVFIDNPSYGIEIVSSSDVEVYNNTVKYATKPTQNGILVIQDERGYPGDCMDSDPNNDPIDSNPNDDQVPCNMQVHNIDVHHNYVKTFVANNTAAGLKIIPYRSPGWKDAGKPSPARFYENYYNIKFDSNRYELANALTYYLWGWSERDTTTILTRWNWFNLHDVPTCSNLLTPDDLWLEAECSHWGSHWTKHTGNNTSLAPDIGRNSYAVAPEDTASHVEFTVLVQHAGDYKIYARVLSPSVNDNSFWVKVNDSDWIKWEMNVNAVFTWQQMLDERFFLKGNQVENKIVFAYREDGTSLDKLYITANGEQPSGVGTPGPSCNLSLLMAPPEATTSVRTDGNVTIYPNPASAYYDIVFPRNSPKDGVLTLRNEMGNKIFRNEIHLEAGANMVRFNIPSNLQDGVYYLKVESGSYNGVHRLVVKR